MARNLRAVPFTNTMLTEMAIRWTKNKQEMLQIKGIDPEKVELFAPKFLELVKNSKQRYDTLMYEKESRRPMDPNHKNVIDLVSDNGEDAVDGVASSQDEQSSYFQQVPGAIDFNKQMHILQNARQAEGKKARSTAMSDEQDGGRRKRGGGPADGKRTSFKKNHRKSGGSNGSEAPPHQGRKKAASGASSPRKVSGTKVGKTAAAGQRTFTGGGIGMMPT